MALILNIETSTTVCSVALAQEGVVLSSKEVNDGYTHAENLTIFIEEVLKQAGKQLSDLNAIAVSMGPGSYTGLRIGVSAAKGLCYALNKPLIAVGTLNNMCDAHGLKQYCEEGTLFCPMIDARRMEVYCEIFDENLDPFVETKAIIIDENTFSELLTDHRMIFFGDGAEKCKAVLSKNKNAVFVDNIFPSARWMAPISEGSFRQKRFVDVAYFEPFYLKDFVAGKKKKV